MATKIHCPDDLDDAEKDKATKFGLWRTLESKSTKKELTAIINNSTKVTTEEHQPEKQNESERFQYSLKTLYSEGIISDKKYQSLRNTFPNMLLPYKTLTSEINRRHVTDLRAFEIADLEGCYRTLENVLLTLAEHYLDSDIEIVWFEEEGVFIVLFGADGAPFGKNSCATSFLVSILNVVDLILSEKHNFLLVAGNVEEDSPDFLRYLTVIRKEMEAVEKQVYTVCGKSIRFKFEFPVNDQKFLAKIRGELSNSATYPSSFANVTQKDVNTIDGSIGEAGDQTKVWQKWDYDKIQQDARAVAQLKKKKPNIARGKITAFIAGRKSRTEFHPPLGKFAMNAKAEPLHLLNLGWQHWHDR